MPCKRLVLISMGRRLSAWASPGVRVDTLKIGAGASEPGVWKDWLSVQRVGCRSPRSSPEQVPYPGRFSCVL